MPEETFADAINGIIKKVTDLTLENMLLRKKLEIALDGLEIIGELPESNMGYWKDKANKTIEEIKETKIES